MIFDPDALLQLAAQLAAKQGIPLPLDRETMCAIVEEAARSAGGHERDEPAALFTRARSGQPRSARSRHRSSTTSRPLRLPPWD